MKKILFAIGQLSNGGAERVVSVLANEFAGYGFDVTIAAVIKDEIEYPISDDITYIHVKIHSTNKIKRIIERTRGLAQIIKSKQPDIIISFTTEINIYSIAARGFKKIPLIISERNDPYRDPPQKIVRQIRDFVYRTADGYVFQTPDAKEYFNNILKGKGTVIPNPVTEGLPKRYEGERSHRVVTVSRLYRQKNLEMLIQAFACVQKKFPGYVLEIYGDGPLENELRLLADRLNIKDSVKFMGFQRDVHSKISDAAMFVLPSDYEGISNAMLEALAIGLPVICTDCPIGGAKMFIKDGENGMLVPVGDRKALESAMTKMIENNELAEKMSVCAADIRKQLSIGKISAAWIKYMEKVTGNQK